MRRKILKVDPQFVVDLAKNTSGRPFRLATLCEGLPDDAHYVGLFFPSGDPTGAHTLNLVVESASFPDIRQDDWIPEARPVFTTIGTSNPGGLNGD